jgi:hypothetical protein
MVVALGAAIGGQSDRAEKFLFHVYFLDQPDQHSEFQFFE